MGTLKKLFLLSIIGWAVCLERLLADEKVDDAIFLIVSKALDKQKIDKTILVEILKQIRLEIMILIKDRSEPEYKKLYQDLKSLTFDNLVVEYWKITETINLLPEKAKIHIEEKINAHIRAMPYWRKKALCLLLKIDLPGQHKSK